MADIHNPTPRLVALDVIETIDKLTAEEGDSVTFLSKDAESFVDVQTIECQGFWTNWKYKRFTGVTWKDCLQQALDDYLKATSDEDEH